METENLKLWSIVVIIKQKKEYMFQHTGYMVRKKSGMPHLFTLLSEKTIKDA